MERFHASVQYNDWIGSAAADNADRRSIGDLLRESGKLREGEFVVGVKLYIGENHDGKVESPYISAQIVEKTDFDTVKEHISATRDPLLVKEVDIDISLDEFFGLFKRFAVTLTPRGLELPGREYATKRN